MTGTELATSTTIKQPNTFNGIAGDSAGPRTDRAPGFSDLESLLSQKGPLGSGTKFKMPNNQLFEYDSAELQGSAVEQLQKVATLIKRNPKATFTLEGYTDSYGSEEYNLDLSRRRAESVKAYLVERARESIPRKSKRAATAKRICSPRRMRRSRNRKLTVAWSSVVHLGQHARAARCEPCSGAL